MAHATLSISNERQSRSIDKSHAAAKRGFQSRTISLVIFVTYLMIQSAFVVGGRIRRVGSYALGRLRLQGQSQAWGLRTVPASRWRWRSNQSVQTRRKRRVRFEPLVAWYIVVAQLVPRVFLYHVRVYIGRTGYVRRRNARTRDASLDAAKCGEKKR